MNFFLDTSICIDVLRSRGPESSISLLKSIEFVNIGYISTITVAELFAGVYLSNRRNAAEKTLDLLSLLKIVDVNIDIARQGGKIYGVLLESGRSIEFNDCLIAATAQISGFDMIVTRNCDHFNRIDGLSAITPEDISHL